MCLPATSPRSLPEPTSFDRVVHLETAASTATNVIFPTPVVPERPGSRARESDRKVKLSFVLQLDHLNPPMPPSNK